MNLALELRLDWRVIDQLCVCLITRETWLKRTRSHEEEGDCMVRLLAGEEVVVSSFHFLAAWPWFSWEGGVKQRQAGELEGRLPLA